MEKYMLKLFISNIERRCFQTLLYIYIVRIEYFLIQNAFVVLVNKMPQNPQW